jgi:methylmalonyl-CoA mutase N-terminal domain/subunit
MVGVNKHRIAEEPPMELLRLDPDVERKQVERVRARKKAREQGRVRDALEAVTMSAKNGTNLMPPILDAVRVGCTVGEISDVFRAVFGEYRDPAWV